MPMPDLEENMVVADRFRLAGMIGRGGMGSVWQAFHLGLEAHAPPSSPATPAAAAAKPGAQKPIYLGF